MRPRGRHSSPPAMRDRSGIPIVQASPTRPNSRLTKSLAQEEDNDNDEIQLCKVPGKSTTDNAHRSHIEYFTRTYHSPGRASSPQLDSWQDASTEPITPYKGEGATPLVYSPPSSRHIKKHCFPISTSPNPIEAPPSHLYVPANMKRKVEDMEPPLSPAKKLTRLSTSQKSKMDIATIIEPIVPADPLPSLPKVQVTVNELMEVEKQVNSVSEPANTKEEKPVEEKDKFTREENEPKKDENESTKEEQSEATENKKLTKEEEAARIAEEIDHLMKTVKNLPHYYKLLDKIGEGTFSTVYKALDIRREFYDNKDWEPQLLTSPTSPSLEEEPNSSKSINDYVALKRIYHTSSPRRIANEIAILKRLRGSPCISPLITAFRQQDTVFVVMPYIHHDDFKKTFTEMTMLDIRYYLKSLFTALTHLHKHKILHRDVKPNNFLYSRRKKTGYLIDFGLAEHEDESKKIEAYIAELEAKSQNNVFLQNSRQVATSNISSSSVLAALTNKENRTSKSAAVAVAGASNNTTTTGETDAGKADRRTMGYVKNDARHQVRANRAGTRGFRAPEILMRVVRQTGAIDIWAAGVILLCFLTGRYPFFIANDESDAVIELAQIFGTRELKECAANYNRTFSCNISLPRNRLNVGKLCEYLNKERMEKWDKEVMNSGLELLERCTDLNFKTRITAAEALEHPFLVINEEKEKKEN